MFKPFDVAFHDDASGSVYNSLLTNQNAAAVFLGVRIVMQWLVVWLQLKLTLIVLLFALRPPCYPVCSLTLTVVGAR